MELFTAFLFGLLAMVCYGISNFTVQPLTRELPGPVIVFYRNALLSSIIFIFLILFSVFQVAPYYLSLKYILIGLGVSLLGYIPYLTLVRALKVGTLGVIIPVTNTTLVFAVLFSFIFLGEVLSLSSGIAILIIFIGLILVSVKSFSKFSCDAETLLSPGVPIALFTSLMWGIMFTLWKIPAMGLGPMLSAFVLEFGLFLYAGIHLKIKRIPLPHLTRTQWKRLFTMGISTGIATPAVMFGMQAGPGAVNLLAALTYSQSAVVALLAHWFRNERLLLRQYLGIAILIGGMFLLMMV
ncbi:TPA: DMT family transporter [Candidatus Woesearchaeota archaeon]|nr:DMT family transporter [Candidatus Woesearchaeota archaeon]HII88306.1 DMT family transporter [Candidatus Woesearchaeota archaeon]